MSRQIRTFVTVSILSALAILVACGDEDTAWWGGTNGAGTGGNGGLAQARDLAGLAVGMGGNGGDINIFGGRGGNGFDGCSVDPNVMGGDGGAGGQATGGTGTPGTGETDGNDGTATYGAGAGNGIPHPIRARGGHLRHRHGPRPPPG